MPLKTLVKVGCITNLSDARYCAGMGVDMLGFRVIEGSENYVSPTFYQELRGWISGPKVVVELYGLNSSEQAAKIIEGYAPDYAELSFTEFKKFGSLFTLPLIVYLTKQELTAANAHHPEVAFWITEQLPDGVKISQPVLLEISNKEGLTDKINVPGLSGIALKGSSEIRPGFKNYDELADVLEMLDEN
jgi:phosphoribosylanthranilate isomerase